MKISKIIIFVLMVAAFGAGIYFLWSECNTNTSSICVAERTTKMYLVHFKDDVVKFYNSLNKQVQSQVQNFQKTDIGQTISQVGREILSPPPLNIGGVAKPVVLLQSKIITETNLQRQQNGNLPALKENTKLDEAASAKANDMFLNQYFEHVSPSGVDPGRLVQSYEYDYIVAGENLILGNFSSEKEVVSDWMASPGHRANILNNRYTEIGAAIIKGTYKGETVWLGVQEFGLPLSTCPQPDEGLKNQIDLYKTQLNNLSLQIDERKTEIDNTNPRSASYGQMVDDYNQLVKNYNSLAEQIKEAIAKYNGQVNVFNNCVFGR